MKVKTSGVSPKYFTFSVVDVFMYFSISQSVCVVHSCIKSECKYLVFIEKISLNPLFLLVLELCRTYLCLLACQNFKWKFAKLQHLVTVLLWMWMDDALHGEGMR